MNSFDIHDFKRNNLNSNLFHTNVDNSCGEFAKLLSSSAAFDTFNATPGLIEPLASRPVAGIFVITFGVGGVTDAARTPYVGILYE